MAVVFLADKKTIVVEHISMDGDYTSREVIFEDKARRHSGNVYLHYMRKTQCLYLLIHDAELFYFFLHHCEDQSESGNLNT